MKIILLKNSVIRQKFCTVLAFDNFEFTRKIPSKIANLTFLVILKRCDFFFRKLCGNDFEFFFDGITKLSFRFPQDQQPKINDVFYLLLL